MAQPDISSILAALAQQQSNGTPQAPTPQQQPAQAQYPPPGYPQPPSAPPQAASYLPQPSSTGSVDLSSIKPVNSGLVSIADAIAKAKSIAADRGVSYDPRQASGISPPPPEHTQDPLDNLYAILTGAATPRSDPRLGDRGYGRSRSRSPPRRDSYGANPYRDERREDSRRGGNRRSPSPDRNFRGARDPPIGYRSNDGETETIHVKSSLVGLIIGRNGENLRKVEAEAGAKVQFLQAKDSHVQERQCTITGSLRARENAKAAIYGIIEENGGPNLMQDKGAYTAGMPGRAKVNLPALRDGENSTQIMVPDKTVGLIIGRGGETIKDLQEKSGCHVNIVGENKSVNGLRPVNLIGSERATHLAKELILEIVESDSRGGQSSNTQRDHGNDSYGQQYGGGNSGGRDHIEKTIRVPSSAVGMIIGKGGETIKDLQRTSGCKINVNSPKPPDTHRAIDLAGTSRAMAEAERVIWEKVRTVEERDAAAGRPAQRGGPPGGAPYDAYSQAQQQPSVPGYGQYMPPGAPQAPPQMPAFQMPTQSDPNASSDPYAAYGGNQAALQQWYAQYMAAYQQQNQGGAAPGTQ